PRFPPRRLGHSRSPSFPLSLRRFSCWHPRRYLITQAMGSSYSRKTRLLQFLRDLRTAPIDARSSRQNPLYAHKPASSFTSTHVHIFLFPPRTTWSSLSPNRFSPWGRWRERRPWRPRSRFRLPQSQRGLLGRRPSGRLLRLREDV